MACIECCCILHQNIQSRADSKQFGIIPLWIALVGHFELPYCYNIQSRADSKQFGIIPLWIALLGHLELPCGYILFFYVCVLPQPLGDSAGKIVTVRNYCIN